MVAVYWHTHTFQVDWFSLGMVLSYFYASLLLVPISGRSSRSALVSRLSIHLRNDLFCVGWDVKPSSSNQVVWFPSFLLHLFEGFPLTEENFWEYWRLYHEE